ncbi:MAG TPA: TonB-dependent receptor [Armatimonadetes bacterium]|nr:TonB-dependent receptor [Armatimonadota bacterium]
MRRVSPLVASLIGGLFIALNGWAQEEIPELAIEVEVEAVKERPAKVEVVETEEMEETVTPQGVVADSLNKLPAVETYYGCLMNSPRVSLRGSFWKWTQVLVEGTPVNLIGACTLNRIPQTAISEVEVIPGAAPPKYPGNTISGIINMRIKTGDEFKGSILKASVGNYGLQGLEATVGGGDERSNFFLAFSRSKWTGWMPHSITNLQDFAGKFVLKPDDRSRLTITILHLSGHKQGFKALGPNPKAKWNFEWHNLSRPAASILYERALSPNSDILIRFSPSALRFTAQFEKWFNMEANPGETADVRRMWTKMRYLAMRTEIMGNLRVGKGRILTYGLFHQRDIMKRTKPAEMPREGAWFSRSMDWFGAFFQQTWAVGEGRTATLGLRWDDIRPGRGALSPFLSLSARPDPNTSWRLQVARNRRFPNLDELYGVGIFHGNPNLKPEKAWVYEIDFERLFPDRRARLSFSLFRSEIRDTIGIDPTNTYRNIGKARIQGVEAEWRQALRNGHFWVNYAFIDAKDLTKGRPLVTDYRTSPSKHMLKAGLTLRGRRGETVGLEVLFFSKKYTDVDAPTVEKYVVDGVVREVTVPPTIPSFPLVNLRLAKSLDPQTSLEISVENLFDKEYSQILFYPRAGRWFKLTLSRRF